jgi:hypothetical protein
VGTNAFSQSFGAGGNVWGASTIADGTVEGGGGVSGMGVQNLGILGYGMAGPGTIGIPAMIAGAPAAIAAFGGAGVAGAGAVGVLGADAYLAAATWASLHSGTVMFVTGMAAAQGNVFIGGGGAPTLYNLGRQLAAEEAAGAFTAAGGLSEAAIQNAEMIMAPGTMGNSAIQEGFAKFTTGTFQSPSGPFQVHFYMNPVTQEVLYELDYKAVFNNGIIPYNLGGQ